MKISETSSPCHNMMDVIDSRDIIERIEELEELIAGESTNENFLEWCTEYDDLKSLEEQCKDYVPDWEDGVGLIRDSYFTEYAMELLSDIGDLPREVPWYIVIDEEATAENIKVDYTEVDFNGVSYFVR